ncbi:hypothetical protein BHE74_00033654 [Ensete ventricosum]|nr:hypothetical protein BHE74_00033654 [Ensete ventricosum]RZS11217.1 hypothetical protein BHM03_00042531 [Ensete ventricosum]
MANKAEKDTSSQGEGRGSNLEKDKAKGKEPTKESTEGPRHFLTMKELYEMGGRTGNVKYFAAWVTDLPGLKTGAPMKNEVLNLKSGMDLDGGNHREADYQPGGQTGIH